MQYGEVFGMPTRYFAEERRQAMEIKVQGKFNAQRFFDTVARIMSQRTNTNITAKVTRKEEEESADTDSLGQTKMPA